MVNFFDVEEVCADADADSTETEEEACANDDGVEETDSVSSSTFRLDEIDAGGVTGAGGLACTSALPFANSCI